jgi:hypothetical protein
MRVSGMNEPLTSAESALGAAQDDVDIQHYFIAIEFMPSASANGSVAGSVSVTAKSLVVRIPAPRLGLAST